MSMQDQPQGSNEAPGEAEVETLRRRGASASFPSANELTRYIPPRVGERTLLVLDAQQGAFEPARGDATLFQIDERGTAHEAPRSDGTLLEVEGKGGSVESLLGPGEESSASTEQLHDGTVVEEPGVVPPAHRQTLLSLDAPWQGEQGRKLTELAQSLRERVQEARSVQREWATSPFAERIAVVRRLRHTLYQRRAELVERLAETLAQPPYESLLTELVATCDLLAEYERSAAEWLAPRRRNCGHAALMGASTWVEVERVPAGVVGMAGSACHPLAELCRTVAAAVLAGNGLVAVLGVQGELATTLQELCTPQVLELDARLVQVLPGSPGARMALSVAGVDHLVTGGEATHVDPKISAYRQSGGSLTLMLESHVSNAMLVRPDADVHAAAQAATTSAFRMSGTAPGSLGRIYVVEDQASEFATHCATLAEQSAAQTDLAAAASPEMLEQARALIEQAATSGARLLTGGALESDGEDSVAAQWHPAVLTECSDEMPAVWQHFAPMLCVVPVEKDALDEHFVKAVNHLPCQAASIFTREINKARELTRRLRVTHVALNDEPRLFLEARAPYVVPAGLGHGVVHGPEALLEYTRQRTRLVNEPHATPKPWWFPYTNAKQEQLENLLARRHAPSLWTRVKSRFKRTR